MGQLGLNGAEAAQTVALWPRWPTGASSDRQPCVLHQGQDEGEEARRKRVVRAARAASANGDPVALIREVKALAGKTGGIDKLKELVEALAE